MIHQPISRFLVPQGLCAAIAAVLASQPASAHGTAEAGLSAGFLHPLSGGDHLLMLIAVGLAAAAISPQLLGWALVGGLVGGVFGAWGGGLPAGEILAALAIPALALPLLRQQRRDQPPALGWWGGLIAATVAVHAMLHGQEAHSSAASALWWLGAFSASSLACGGSFLLWRSLPSRWSRWAALVLAVFGGLLALAQIGLQVR
jgi:urease accessory protein